MQKLLNFALILMIAASIPACSKDDDDPAPSNTTLLTKADWKIVNTELDTAGVYFSLLPYTDPCDEDDITSFKTDHTYKVVEGATKCDQGDPDTVESGNWQFSSDEKMLILGIYSFTVETLTETSLITSISDGPYKYRFTYGH